MATLTRVGNYRARPSDERKRRTPSRLEPRWRRFGLLLLFGEDRFDLIHNRIHAGHEGAVRRGRSEVDAGAFHELVRMIGAAGLEQTEIGFNGAGFALENAIGEGGAGGDRRGVLVDVIAAVEVRD